MKQTDFHYRTTGSIIILIPETVKAHLWVKDNIPLKDYQNPDAIEIEFRFYSDIEEGIIRDGLTIEKSE
jgi:hypothetical protein